jgi:uncharacterized tellurite resistance protein B-like protein
MIEEPKPPRIEGHEVVVETQSGTETYDAKYLVSALLVFVAKGGGSISEEETAKMLDLVSDHFGLHSSESLEIITNAMEDLAGNPDFEGLLRELSKLLDVAEKEDVALMMLKVAAANGRKDAEEMEKLRIAADIIDVSSETMHRAYDRYFAETFT